LAMSKKIIEDHGGQISLNSETQANATLTIELPLQLIG
jgi:signal transduction histidine kinase